MKQKKKLNIYENLLVFTSLLALFIFGKPVLKLEAAEVLIQDREKLGTQKHQASLLPVEELKKLDLERTVAQVNQSPEPSQPLPKPLNPELESPPSNERLEQFPKHEEKIDVFIKKIKVEGNTTLNQQEIDQITQPLEGKTISLAKLRLAVDDLTQLYLKQGYITSRAILVRESLNDGNIRIRLVEGAVKGIEVKGTKRLENYVRDRINLAADTPVNTAKLEDQLRLLRLDPLFNNVEASLSAGDNPEVGKSVIKVRVEESDRISARISFDNYSPPSIGAERLGAELDYQYLRQMKS